MSLPRISMVEVFKMHVIKVSQSFIQKILYKLRQTKFIISWKQTKTIQTQIAILTIWRRWLVCW